MKAVYQIISDRHTEDIALWMEEQSLEGVAVFIDPYTAKTQYLNITQLRDSIFNQRIWGSCEYDDTQEIKALVLFHMPAHTKSHLRFATVAAYGGDGHDFGLLEYALKALKEEYGDEIQKVKFRHLSKTGFSEQFGRMAEHLPLTKEVTVETGAGEKNIFSYFWESEK